MKSILYGVLMFALVSCSGNDAATDTAAGDTAATQTAATDTATTAAASDTTATTATTTTQEGTSTMSSEGYQDQVAVLKTTAGDIHIRFFPDIAPNHVKNFLDLARKGFYNGTKFHRVIPGFMIQGGDPNTISGDPRTWGTGGSENYVRAEFSKVPHRRGIVSMARSSDPNSASSQFFIVTTDSTFLDNQYTVFGEVTQGMDVADKIVNAQSDRQTNRPASPVAITSIEVRPAKENEKGAAPLPQ